MITDMWLEQQFKVFKGRSNLQVSKNRKISSAQLITNHATKCQSSCYFLRKSNQIVPGSMFYRTLTWALIFQADSTENFIQGLFLNLQTPLRKRSQFDNYPKIKREKLAIQKHHLLLQSNLNLIYFKEIVKFLKFFLLGFQQLKLIIEATAYKAIRVKILTVLHQISKEKL